MSMKHNLPLISLLATGFALSSPVSAQELQAAESTEEATDDDAASLAALVDDWVIWQDDEASYCAMSAAYISDEVLTVTFDAKAGSSRLLFRSNESTSLEDGRSLKLNVFMKSDNGSHSGEGWDGVTFSVNVAEGGQRGFISERLDKEILNDVARYNDVGFFTGETLVESFNLEGSAKAVAALRACAFEVAGLNPDDPFLK